MVKRQKEKLYESSREHKANAAQRAYSGTTSNSDTASSTASASASRRLLPFSHCALTLTPFETPVCNKQGIVFENSAILPFILQHGNIDPCTGQIMSTRDLITLNIHQQSTSEDGGTREQQQWACPIMNKPFVQHSKIIAIILDNNNNNNNKHANVYSWQAYQELCIKANHYEDLLSGQPFDKNKDVLVLYDPNDDDLNRRRDINTFFHITNARQLQNSNNNNDKSSSVIQHSMTATRIMQQLAKNKQEKQQQDQQDSKKRAAAAEAAIADTAVDANQEQQQGSSKRIKRPLLNPDGLILARDVTGVRYTTTGGAASFTSTGVGVHLDNCDRPATEDEILQAQLLVLKGKGKKKLQHNKGLVKMITNMGIITVELHCDIAPRTCYNFLNLCRNGSYNGSKFHRLIPNFMIQGGKQTTTFKNNSGSSATTVITEDESFWGYCSFVDEFDDRLKHDGPGVLSMANSGPNTNRRQFFFTFKACPHLNRKHTVFGNVIDDNGISMQVLQEMEKVPTNTDAKKDHVPIHKIYIQSIIILVDPVQEAIQLEQERLEGIIAARKRKQQAVQQQQTTTTNAAAAATTTTAETTASQKSAAEKSDEKDSSTSSINSNNDDVGHFLREQLKQRAAVAAAAKKNGSGKKKAVAKKDDDTEQEPAVPATATLRRPPPPPPSKATNFGNFSAW